MLCGCGFGAPGAGSGPQRPFGDLEGLLDAVRRIDDFFTRTAALIHDRDGLCRWPWLVDDVIWTRITMAAVVLAIADTGWWLLGERTAAELHARAARRDVRDLRPRSRRARPAAPSP